MRLSEPIRNPVDAGSHLRKAIPRGRIGLQECLVAVALDIRHRVVGKPILVAMGTANSVEAHPRDIFREAVRRNAVAILVGHNHPSGELSPSEQDRNLVDRIDSAGKILGIQVLDHIVFSKNGHRAMVNGEWILASQGAVR
jgi:DNA repair protein RadC